MKPAIDLYLITASACNLLCKSCPSGRRETGQGGIMSPEMLDRILCKCTAEATVLVVQLYFYNETFMVPHMDKLIGVCHKYKAPALLSTNLTLFKRGPAILAARPDRLIISVSGWTQPIYERSHKGGNIEVVKKNMAEVARLRDPRTDISVTWHRYPYNEHEMPLMREYAHKLGFTFLSYGTSLCPPLRALEVWKTGIEDSSSEDLMIPVMAAKQMCYERRHWDCSAQDHIVTIDSKGTLLHCNGASDDEVNRRGSLFDTTIPAFLKAKRTDPACLACKAVGGHVYQMFQYTRSEWSPARLAGVFYRRLGLSSLLDPTVRRFYGRALMPVAKRWISKRKTPVEADGCGCNGNGSK
jgi:MoaA/NifB/PqqE/SkfB family radical SAM enzyme